MVLDFYEKRFTIRNSYHFAKSEKYETFFVSKLLIWHQKCVAGVRHGNSQSVTSYRKLVVLFWEKYVIAGKIKIGILKLTIRRGQSNLNVGYILVGWEENGFYYCAQ